jgi:peptidoglycan/xylan/chitin deacetylase (PgdA/CDA1 family)
MDQSLRHRLIGASLGLIAATRADRCLRPLTQGRGAILMLHHVRPARSDPFQPNALLEITPDFLERTIRVVRDSGFDIVALDEVPSRLSEPKAKPFVAFTFDDGLRDNVTFALPVLKRHACPWTLFVVADYAAGRGRLWWIELEEAVRRLDRLTLERQDGTTLLCPAATPAEKTAAFAAIYSDLRAGPEPRLRALIAGWCKEAGIDSDALVRAECLDWDEIRALASEPGVTIGAHTLSHPMLAKHDDDTSRREIVESRAAIAAALGRPVQHFAYPVGDPTSAGAREFQTARDAGYMTAVTTRPGHLYPEHLDHLTALPRVSINGLHQNEAALRTLLSGLPFALRNRGRRLIVA